MKRKIKCSWCGAVEEIEFSEEEVRLLFEEGAGEGWICARCMHDPDPENSSIHVASLSVLFEKIKLTNTRTGREAECDLGFLMHLLNLIDYTKKDAKKYAHDLNEIITKLDQNPFIKNRI